MKKSIFGEEVPLESSAHDFSGEVSEDNQPATLPLLVSVAPSPARFPVVAQPSPQSNMSDKGKEEAAGGMQEVRPPRQVSTVSYQQGGDVENQLVRQRRRDHNHSHQLQQVATRDDAVPYDTIAQYMPEFEFRGISRANKAILGFAVVLAIVASLYNAQFAGTFGSFISDAVGLVWYFSIMAFTANVPINIRSIKMSADKVRSDLVSRWKPDRLPLPDDQQIKDGIKIKAGIAAVGAFPPMLFAIEKPLFGVKALANWGVYLPLMATQLVVVGAQNLRGLTKDDDMHKQAAVFHFREILLYRIAACLDGDIPDQFMQDIKSMAQGKFSAPSESKLKKYLGGFLGWAYFAYIGIHAAATGFSVYRKLKKALHLMPVITPIVNSTISNSNTTSTPQYIETGSVLYDGAIILIGTVALISFFLRWMLLGRSAKGFVDSMFALGNRSYFQLDNIEVIDSVFAPDQHKRRLAAQITSVAVSLTVGISSLGSASEIPHANFFNDSPDAGPMVASFGIGGGAAGPINTLDFKSLLDTLSGYFYIWARSKGRNYEASDRFGQSRNEFLLKFMRIITAMSVSEFANRFLVTFNSSVETLEQEFQRMGITAQQFDACVYMKREGLNGVGYARNDTLQNLYHDLNTLGGHGPSLFRAWKQGELPSQGEKIKHDRLVRQEATGAAVPHSPSSPILSRAKSADDKTPLVQHDSARHSIN